MGEEKINALYVTKMNHDKPIMTIKKAGDKIALDIHTQFIDVKSKDINITVKIKDQKENVLDSFQKNISTPLTKSPINESLIGEITTFLILDKEDLDNVNMLTFDVKINHSPTATTVLFFKEESHG